MNCLESAGSSDIALRVIALRDVRIQALSCQVRAVPAREERQMVTMDRCHAIVKQLLVEKSNMERKKARAESMANRMRMGQFVTQRVGLEFQEVCVDGYGFSNLTKRQETVAMEKEELDRKRNTW